MSSTIDSITGFSKVSVTDAMPPGLRAAEPAKITSIISLPRSDLLDRSPSTHLIASTTLDLPQPFGPTIPVIGSSKVKVVRSAKLLKPATVSLDSRSPAVRSISAGRACTP